LIQFPDLSDLGDVAGLRDDLMDVTSQRTIREFGQAVESFAREELMVLGLDDIHHADSSTLDLLAHIGNRTETAKLLVIATAEEGPDWDKVRALTAPLYVRHLCEQIRLDVLSEVDVKRILDAKYPTSNVGDLLSIPLHKISNGVPLFLSSAIEYMEEQKWILRTGNGWLASIPAVRMEELMPPVLSDLVDTQLAVLPSEHRQILEAASIIGLEFTSRLVGYALGQSSRAVEEQCTNILRNSRWLETAGFATTPDGEISPQFRFRRKVFKEVLYARQTPSQRVERHRRIANALEEAMADRAQESASELAFHFAAGKNCSKSLKYLRLAAANATRRYAGVEAAALLTDALKFTARLPRADRIRTELEILNDLGTAYLVSGDLEHCARVWHQVAVKAMKQARTDIAVSALSRLAFPVGWDNPARLRSCADKVMAQIDKVEDPATRAEITLRALSLRDVSGTWNSDHAAMASEALKEMSGIDDPVRLACARITHSWLQLRHAKYGAVISEIEDALRVVLQHRCVEVIRAELVLAWALLHAGEWGRMYSVVTSAAAHANKQGNTRIEAIFKTQLAWLSVECGEYDNARELCSAALQRSVHTNQGLGSAMRHVIAGMAAIGLQDPDDALAHVASARRSVPSGEPFWRVLAEMTAVNAHILRPKPSEAHRASKRLLALASSMPENTWKAIALSTCAKAASLNGLENEALEHLRCAIHIIDTDDLPLAARHVDAAAAEIFASYGSREEAAQFAHRSRNSRERLFNSLASKDPLSRQADKAALLPSDSLNRLA
jgi:predicted ATPase